jgi:two-component system, sensor histidine kinase and response regulator
VNKPSVLVIDDEPDNFDVIEALLPDRGYKLHYASNGTDAIASLEFLQPDVILLDVMMPGMDGMEVCKRIKTLPQWQPVPIIMVTALTAKEDLARCLKAGADDFISKPVNGLELRSRVHSMLRIKQQYDNLQALLKLREEMMHIVIHDLRNPLTNILFGLDTLEIQHFSPEQQHAKISQLKLSGQQLQLIIDNLLLITKIESGKLQLNPTTIDLCDLIPAVCSGFEGIAEQKKIALVSHLPNGEASICADVAMFHRVLDNLLSNAIKFAPRCSKVVITVDTLPTGSTRIQVADCGPGVPEALQQKIFEKYEIGTLMQNVPQIGLGLAFCKMVVEAHKGQISVQNNHPKGSIFEIILPPQPSNG